MNFWDVNLWVYAFRRESPFHDLARAELDPPQAANAFLHCPHVVASFLRLVTNPRIFVEPSEIEEAWGFVDNLEARAGAVKVDIDPMTFGIFKHLSLVSRAAGNDVPDALLASIAIRHDATFVTLDQDFERFTGLRCRFLEV